MQANKQNSNFFAEKEQLLQKARDKVILKKYIRVVKKFKILNLINFLAN